MGKPIISIISVIVILFGLTVPILNASANNGDSTPPVLHSLEITPKELNVGDTLEIIADVTDDFSGVKDVAVYFFHEEHSKKDHIVHLRYDEIEGLWMGDYRVTETDLNGKWSLNAYQTTDIAGNHEYFYVKDDESFFNHYYIVNNPNEVDVTPPIVEIIEVSPKVVEVGQDITIKVKAHDQSEIEGISFSFKRPIDKNPSFSISGFNYDEETDLWIGKYTITKYDISGYW